MKKITIPKETYKQMVEGNAEDAGMLTFITLILRNAPSSMSGVDKIFQVGKLIDKLKSNKGNILEVDEDDYKIISGVMLGEMFQTWNRLKQQGSETAPTGWEAINSNPLQEPFITYLRAIKDAE